MTATSEAETALSVPSARDDDPVVEALRGVAAILVMATHFVHFLMPQAGLWGFASTGVDLFFVLSGYVFAPYLLGKPLALVPHLVRRFFRLYPLYLCALLLYVGLRLPEPSAWKHMLSHVLMAHTLSSVEAANFYNSAFWSLPPEVEYYMLLPMIAWLGRGASTARYRFTAWVLLAGLIHLALVAAAKTDEGISARAIATVHLPGLLIEFMCGSMAYVWVKAAPGARARLARLTLGLLILLGMGYVYARYVMPVKGVSVATPIWIAGNVGLGVAIGYALLVSAVVRISPMRSSPRIKVWCLTMGQLSYGVYLFHNATPQIIKRVLFEVNGAGAVTLCVVLTITLAWVAHHAVERPLRNYGRRLSQALGSKPDVGNDGGTSDAR